MRSLMSLKCSTTRTTATLSLNSKRLSDCSNSRRQLSFTNETYNSSFPRIENILVLGAGAMGSGIAQSCAFTGRFTSVTLQDISLIALSKARERILTSLNRQYRLDSEAAESVLDRITMSTRYFSNRKTNTRLLIIEAIPEVLELKQTLFRSLNSQFARNEAVIVASCSASLPRDDVSQYFEAKERFAGLSFNPEPTMQMVKVIRTAETSGQTMRLLQRFVADLDKVCVVSSDAKIEQ